MKTFLDTYGRLLYALFLVGMNLLAIWCFNQSTPGWVVAGTGVSLTFALLLLVLSPQVSSALAATFRRMAATLDSLYP